MGVLIFTDDEALDASVVAGASGVLLVDGDDETEVLDLPSSGEGTLVSSIAGPPGEPGDTRIKHIGPDFPDTTGWNVNDLWFDTSTET